MHNSWSRISGSKLNIPGYILRIGSSLERALLVKFVHRTYTELFLGQDLNHLSQTVEQYFSTQTPLWWVDWTNPDTQTQEPIACLWLGNAVDQVDGERIAHIFLLYVAPAHRKQGLGSVLIQQAELWAKQRGDRKISLQVFSNNTPALHLYQKLGYQTYSLSMHKLL